tara:strand:- start:134 stop:1501 length:1368 start_codon:yes stop_codon:yes gene_type:complete
MASIFDIISGIYDKEVARDTAEQRLALDAMELETSSKFTALANARAEKELAVKLQNELEEDLNEQLDTLNIGIKENVDNVVDNFFRPLFVDAKDNNTYKNLPIDSALLDNPEYKKEVITQYTNLGFSDKQANKVYNAVSAYIVNPNQPSIITGLMKDITTSGKFSTWAKPFSNIGLFGDITGKDVYSEYAKESGEAALKRFVIMEDHKENLKEEILELQNLGDMDITRETGMPDEGFDFDLEKAFKSEMESGTLQAKKDSDNIYNVLDQIKMYSGDKTVTDEVLDGYTVQERKDIMNAFTSLIGSVNDKNKVSIVGDTIPIEKHNRYGKEFKNLYGLQFNQRNEGETLTNNSEAQLKQALKQIAEDYKKLEDEKSQVVNTMDKNVENYRKYYSQSGTISEDDKESYLNTGAQPYDARLDILNSLKTLLEYDLNVLTNPEWKYELLDEIPGTEKKK